MAPRAVNAGAVANRKAIRMTAADYPEDPMRTIPGPSAADSALVRGVAPAGGVPSSAVHSEEHRGRVGNSGTAQSQIGPFAFWDADHFVSSGSARPDPTVPRAAQVGQSTRYETWARVLRRDPCAYCGARGGTVDHIVPGHAAEWDVPENLTGACQSCNGTKGRDRTLLDMAGTKPIVRGVHAWNRHKRRVSS